MKRTFTVKALWDDEAEVYISESDIIGLHIEAETIEEFEGLMHELAVDLIFENHIAAPEIATSSLRDLVPGILWQRPEPRLAVA